MTPCVRQISFCKVEHIRYSSFHDCQDAVVTFISASIDQQIFSTILPQFIADRIFSGPVRTGGLHIYDRHSQKNAIDIMDRVQKKFPFRIHPIHTGNGYGLQAAFNWHCEDLGIRHVSTPKASPYLNGKVERFYLTDKQAFNQLVECVEDSTIQKTLQEWETFFNYHRHSAALHGKTPYEVLSEKLIPAEAFPDLSLP